jgi:hypothetical protein
MGEWREVKLGELLGIKDLNSGRYYLRTQSNHKTHRSKFVAYYQLAKKRV